MFVSRGVGTVYVPVRINCPPEVAVLHACRSGLSDRVTIDEPPVRSTAPAAVEHDRRIASGIDPVLLDQDPRRQRLDRVVVEHRHRGLQDDRPAIELAPSTRCTVAPVTRTPCSSACRCASRPGNAGSSDGWMFRIRFGKRLEQRRPDQPHEAGEADQVDVARCEQSSTSARSYASRSA